jgi:hypothetical protein
VTSIPREQLPAAFMHATSVMSALAAVAALPTEPDTGRDNDRLLTLDEAAVRANVTVRWLLRHRDLPIFVSLSRKQLRVSERKFVRWIEQRAGR